MQNLREYYIAIRVYDDSAPNDMDTYAWIDPVSIGAPVLLIVDDLSSGAYSAITGDLSLIGLGYTEKSSSAVTAADFSGAQLVIWHGKDNATSYSPSRITSTLKTLFTNYWNAGGDTLMIIPYEYYYYIGGGSDYNWLRNYWDISQDQSPYCYLYAYSSYYSYYYDNCPTFNGANSGPGGTCNNIYYGKSPSPQHSTRAYNYYNRIDSTEKLIQGGYAYSYYAKCWKFVTTGGGTNVPYGSAWFDTNTSSMSGTAGRHGLLRNLIEVANPDIM